ncbi:MAG TPA: diguanylate cyclase [Thermodesulfovibrionales bacterium]|nr:diguanylate cyclase [Thermodesulfovibrionales bacterium]
MSTVQRLSEYFEHKSKPFLIAVNITLLLCIGFVDYITGYEIGISLFYLIPISFAGWFGGRSPSIIISFLSVLTMAATDFLAGKEYGHFLVECWNLLMHLGFFVVCGVLLFSLGKALEREKENARRDYLTGINNFQGFKELAEREIERSRRYGTVLSAAYIDCDNFKEVNDTLGHDAGGRVLRAVADAIQKHVRATDIAARIGGDEFVVLLTDVSHDISVGFVEKMRRLLLQEMKRNNWNVTFSIGMVSFSTPPLSVEEILKKSDTLMYCVKRETKDAIKHEVV